MEQGAAVLRELHATAPQQSAPLIVSLYGALEDNDPDQVAVLTAQGELLLRAWNPSDHPRDRHGRFGSGGSVKERATKTYHYLFNRIRSALGVPDATAPRMTLVPAGTGYTTSGVDNWGDVVSVQIGPNAARQLASKDPKVRAQAEFAILHEFGRVFGPTAAYQASDGNTGAGFANEFANQATRYLNGKISHRQFRRWAQANVPHWGVDPATITVPEPNA